MKEVQTETVSYFLGIGEYNNTGFTWVIFGRFYWLSNFAQMENNPVHALKGVLWHEPHIMQYHLCIWSYWNFKNKNKFIENFFKKRRVDLLHRLKFWKTAKMTITGQKIRISIKKNYLESKNQIFILPP